MKVDTLKAPVNLYRTPTPTHSLAITSGMLTAISSGQWQPWIAALPLIRAHQHGIAVGPSERTKPCIKGPFSYYGGERKALLEVITCLKLTNGLIEIRLQPFVGIEITLGKILFGTRLGLLTESCICFTLYILM